MSAEIAAFIQEAEAKVLRRLVQLTDSENPRIALRACELVLRYARDLRREEAQQTSASGGRKPPEGAPSDVSGAPSDVSGAPSDVSGAPSDVSGAPSDVSGAPSMSLGAPSGGLRPPLAEVKTIPHKLVHPPKPVPPFRAVPAAPRVAPMG